MANVLELTNKLQWPNGYDGTTGIQKLDFTRVLSSPILLPNTTLPKMQVCCVQVSDRIPNIYDATGYYSWNNTPLIVGLLPVGTYLTIHLPRGMYYNVEQIAAAINSAINNNPLGSTWYADSNQPALTITTNTISDKVYIGIDQRKMANPAWRLSLDISKAGAGTDLATTLGFGQTTTVFCPGAGLSGLYESDLEVKMDTQGVAMDIKFNEGAERNRDGRISRTVAVIPFAGHTDVADITWPSQGQVSPIIIFSGNRTVKTATIEIKTMDGRPMLFMDGGIFLQVAFFT
jgi:hypothetical protein